MDKIIISQLEFNVIIGIYEHERTQVQPIILDLEMGYDSRAAAKSDNISDALDYTQVVRRLEEFVSQSRFFLIETLANQIADILLMEFPIKYIQLALYKPRAIEQAKHVALVIERYARN